MLRAVAGLALIAPALAAGTAVRADTLAAAIASAYDNNPDLASQRAIVRQFDEGVPQALAPGRPTVSGTLSANQSALSLVDSGRNYAAGAQINQSLYRGGRIGSAVSAAENRILAARARLRATENTVVLNVVTAYVDVLRYQRVVELNENQVKVFERQLQSSKDRFEVGDVTRTDVAQSQASLATGQSNLIVAQNQLDAARQAYLRVVGRFPEDLAPMPPLPNLPGSAGEAVDFARENNPGLLAARFDEAAARYDVKTLQKQRLPSVDAVGQVTYTQYQGGGALTFVRPGGYFTQSGSITATVPIFQAGLVGSQVRQQQAKQSQLLETISSTSRATDESVTNSFNQLRAARAVIDSTKVAVDANALAAEGVRQENQVGTRTVIEVLTAEQTLLQTQVNLVQARRDEQVAAYSLLAAVGAAEAVALGEPVTEYDAVINARKVRHSLNDTTHETLPIQPLPPAERASRTLVIGPPQP